ncbi:MAG: hypothetical protein KJ732_01300, partial [Candidatus Margulisbacteria bacterium]|nr:hypothetical protein [Candidatus Margulisiibacteriota bacterium]
MPRLKFFLLSVVILVAAFIVSSCNNSVELETTTTTATTSTQTPIKGPDRADGQMNDNDQTFRSLTVSNISPEVVFLGSEGNGIFRSTDGGTSWDWLRSGLLHTGTSYPEIYDIAIHPSNNDSVYAATLTGYGVSDFGGPYKSTDSGDNWARKINGLGNNYYASSITIDPANPSTLYLAIGAGTSTGGSDQGTFYNGAIYKSTDSGDTWSSLNVPSPTDQNRITKIIAWDSNNIYFLGTNFTDTTEAAGLMKSADAGQSWAAINTPNIHVAAFDVAPLNKNIIIISQR